MIYRAEAENIALDYIEYFDADSPEDAAEKFAIDCGVGDGEVRVRVSQKWLDDETKTGREWVVTVKVSQAWEAHTIGSTEITC